MTRIGVISDTHFSSGSQRLPWEVEQGLRDAKVQLILHAGDLVAIDSLRAIELIAPVLAVRGNIFNEANETLTPAKRIVEIEKCRVGLIHYYAPESSGAFDSKVDCIVFGHTHRPENRRRGGILLFNPGSPTDKRNERKHSYGILTVNGNKIKGEIIRF